MKAGLLGAGAVGSSLIYFAGKMGQKLTVIAEGERNERLREGLWINGGPFYLDLDFSSKSPLDILFISVKSTGLEGVLKDLNNYIDKDTIIVSLLNGISTEESIRKKYPNPVIHSVVRGSFVRKWNEVFFEENKISITIGTAYGDEKSLEKVKQYLKSIRYPTVLSTDIITNMWSKFCINVSENLIAGVLDFNYGKMKDPNIIEAIKLVQREVVKVGSYYGAKLSEENIKDNIQALEEEIDEGVPSTLQDLRTGRKTEVDLFAGEIIRLGEAAGIETPYSELLYHLVKGKENNIIYYKEDIIKQQKQ